MPRATCAATKRQPKVARRPASMSAICARTTTRRSLGSYLDMDEERVCRDCKERKPIAQFTQCGRSPHHRDPLCKPCRAYQRKLQRIEVAEYFERVRRNG